MSGSTLAQWLTDRFGIEPRDLDLFERALTHRSASPRNYERLEFLGDSVLSLLVAEQLFTLYPDADEGDLSRLRARVVSEDPLAELATEFGVGDRLQLGAGELRTGGFRRRSILADAFEALCGAIYLDGGLQAARSALGAALDARIRALPNAQELKDAKTRLQEHLQGRGLPLPNYSLVRAEGEPHAQTFLVRCEVPALGLTTEGAGHSRRRAEQRAAEGVLVGLGLAPAVAERVP